jgi:YVTN family beta-propeller protein
MPFRVSAVLALALLMAACDGFGGQQPASAPPAPEPAAKGTPARGRVVVANRGSGSLSVIDTRTDAVIDTVPLPGDSPAEPMYVVYIPAMHRVLVGDRANDQVVAFDAGDFSIEGTVPAGDGIWHMWADPQSKQLWVVDDINNVLTVIDPVRLDVLTTIPVAGGRPHDVILDPRGEYAFVSVVVAEGADQVVKYSTDTFDEVGRADVGEDPHLSLARQNDRLYVPSQGSNAVFVLDRTSMEVVTVIDAPGAHGAAMTRAGDVFYTTNLPGGGTNGIIAIDMETNAILGAVNTPLTGALIPVPHNLALTPNGKQLYLTHSGGTANQVSIYHTTGNDPLPSFSAVVTVGTNPFGLAYIP